MSNTCKCPKPPGGSVECEGDQLAVCAYVDGEIVARCYSRPRRIRTIHAPWLKERALRNWAISMITDAERKPGALIESHLLEMLRSGKYTRDGNLLTFTLPKDFRF
jgi:hypothetical protein